MMGKETRLFKSEERKSRSDVGEFLHQLADKIAQGQVVLSQGQEEIALKLPHSVILEVQVEDEDKKAKGVQHSLEVEIKWFDNEQGGPIDVRVRKKVFVREKAATDSGLFCWVLVLPKSLLNIGTGLGQTAVCQSK